MIGGVDAGAGAAGAGWRGERGAAAGLSANLELASPPLGAVGGRFAAGCCLGGGCSTVFGATGSGLGASAGGVATAAGGAAGGGAAMATVSTVSTVSTTRESLTGSKSSKKRSSSVRPPNWSSILIRNKLNRYRGKELNDSSRSPLRQYFGIWSKRTRSWLAKFEALGYLDRCEPCLIGQVGGQSPARIEC